MEQWPALQLYFISEYFEVNGVKPYELGELMNDTSYKEKVRLPYLYSQFEVNFKLILSNFVKINYIKNLISLQTVNLFDAKNYIDVENIFIGRKAELCMQQGNLSDIEKLEIKKIYNLFTLNS